MQRLKSLAQSARPQIYISRIHDPFLNLSFEHFLLQNSHPESIILFLYINRPCIVIGRNQNPWLEINFDLLHRSVGAREKVQHSLHDVDILRRRSGGGAVFHDEGNLNYNVICPPKIFTRDKHVEMAARVARKYNDRAHVNQRHDIVLDQGDRLSPQDIPSESDMHVSAYKASDDKLPSLKVSGSAFKLVRNRALHHGTLLIDSKNLGGISKYLTSPARPFLKVRGIESVRSPVGNILPPQYPKQGAMRNFEHDLIYAFARMYEIKDLRLDRPETSIVSEMSHNTLIREHENWIFANVSGDISHIEEVADGVSELKSSKWFYEQTPRFAVSSHPEAQDGSQPNSSDGTGHYNLSPSMRVHLEVASGRITHSNISLPSQDEADHLNQVLKDTSIHQVENFRSLLSSSISTADMKVNSRQQKSDAMKVAQWLSWIFGKGFTSARDP